MWIAAEVAGVSRRFLCKTSVLPTAQEYQGEKKGKKKEKVIKKKMYIEKKLFLVLVNIFQYVQMKKKKQNNFNLLQHPL